jgi:hypothetical protein
MHCPDPASASLLFRHDRKGVVGGDKIDLETLAELLPSGIPGLPAMTTATTSPRPISTIALRACRSTRSPQWCLSISTDSPVQ